MSGPSNYILSPASPSTYGSGSPASNYSAESPSYSPSSPNYSPSSPAYPVEDNDEERRE